jgi:hypothetical protein
MLALCAERASERRIGTALAAMARERESPVGVCKAVTSTILPFE